MVEVKWRGPVTGFSFPFYRPNRLRNQTSPKPVVGGRHVEWEEEFEHICCLAGGPWDLSFDVFCAENTEAKNGKAVIGKASLVLLELASAAESTVERMLPIELKGSDLAKEAALAVSVNLAEARNEPDSARLAQNSENPWKTVKRRSSRKMAKAKGGEHDEPSGHGKFESSHSPATDLSSDSDSRSGPVQKQTGLPSRKRRRLSLPLSRIREPRGDQATKLLAKPNKQEESSIGAKKWELKDLVSRDGKWKLRSELLLASIDQRSKQAAGEAACAAVVVLVAHWLHVNPRVTPSGPEFDSLIMQGSSLWQSLCNNELYLISFPDKHFDLETVVSANLRPIRVCLENSFTGVFSPEKFDSLAGLMSFDGIWDEIEKNVANAGFGESRIYIFSWNDHFFVLKADLDGFYIIDSLGERLFEGCKQAYILKFDDSSLIYDNKISEKPKGKTPNPSSEDKEGDEEEGGDGGDEETVVCRGKECCREYIKGFMAAIPVAELVEEEEKGTVLDASLLHKRLQIDLHHILMTH